MTSIGEFLTKYWSLFAALGAFILSHVRLSSAFDSEKERGAERYDTVTRTLVEIKEEVKEVRGKVEESTQRANDIHVELLRQIATKDK